MKFSNEIFMLVKFEEANMHSIIVKYKEIIGIIISKKYVTPNLKMNP
jgi:hypothetical protein